MRLKSVANPMALLLGTLGIAVAASIVNVAVAETSSEVIPQGTVSETLDTPVAITPINLSVDVNQDEISDQLLAEIQKNKATHDALLERYQASSNNGEFNEAAYEEYSAATLEANMQLEARMPYPDHIRPVLNQFNQVSEQHGEYIQEFGEDGPEALALVTELRQLSEQLYQDAGFVEVVEATQKIYEFLAEG